MRNLYWIALVFTVGLVSFQFSDVVYSVTEPYLKITMDGGQTTDPIQIVDSADSSVFNINGTGFIESDFNGTCSNDDFVIYDSTDGAFNCFTTPMGEIHYFDTTGTTVDIVSQSDGLTNLVEVDVGTTLNSDSMLFDMPSNGTLRYTGVDTKNFHIAMTISTASTVANEIFVYAVCIDGGTDHTGDARIIKKIGTQGDTSSSAMHLFTTLSTNQEVSLCLGNLGGSDDGIVKTLNIFAMGM